MNIPFKTPLLAAYFSNTRDKWGDFYPSERWIIERVAGEAGGLGKVLDVGCAAGGLGLALAERGLAVSYSGIDVNEPVVDAALKNIGRFAIPARFERGDIVSTASFGGDRFDSVFNLSCADWNLDTKAIIDASWARVAPEGRLILSLRLSAGPGINDISRSYQPIIAEGAQEAVPERANYAVFNTLDALRLLTGIEPAPSRLLGYGYWGKPSKTAVTPYDALVFAVFALWKGTERKDVPSMELHLPLSLWAPAKD